MENPSRWECHTCARVVDLTADDFCPVCGAELPLLDPESPIVLNAEQGRLFRALFTPRLEGK